MKCLSTILVVILTALTLNAQEESKPFFRYPALSPDGKTICFSCKGDLWLVPSDGGQATRLTVHPADDIMPQFSPDGQTILFTSERYDNRDIYIIPATGGEPERLTYYTGSDYGTGWTPDGDSVVFHSFRQFNYDAFKMSINGGTPVAMTGGHWDTEYSGKISPDGKKLIFNNGSGRYRWWKANLAGNTNSDIWMLDRTRDEFTLDRITSEDGHDLWPVYDQADEVVYFIANRDNTVANLWKKDLSSGAESQITNYSEDGAQWLNSNPQMDKMVFEQNFDIWYFDPEAGSPGVVDIELTADNKTNPVKQMTFSGDIQEYDISPDGELAVLVIRGELFLIPTDEPKFARRITDTPQREKHPCFGPESKTIYYISDRAGNYDIYSYDLAQKEETQITSTPRNEAKPLCSPDGKKLVYYRELDKVIVYDLENKTESDTITGMFIDLAIEPHIEYDFSPDSRYFTLTMAGDTYETNIFITDFESDFVNVSHYTDQCYRPRFSKDGELVYFSRWSHDDVTSTFKIELAPDPFEFEEDRIDSILLDKKKEEKEKKDEDEKKVEPVKIDFDDIHKRVSRAINLDASSHYPVITADGETIIFVAGIMDKPEIWSAKLEEDDPDLTQLTHSGQPKSDLKISADSKYVYFLEGGKLKKLNIKDKKVENLGFTAEMDVVVDKENRQKFNETWWMFDEYYYDPDLHGVDWDRIREKYNPLVDEIETEDEFRQIILEMMGDLESSHVNIYSQGGGPKKELSTAWYGFHLDQNELDENGLYRISLVIPNSPAALADTPLETGDYILAINGQTINRETNIYPLLNGQIDKKTIFTVAKSPDGNPYDVAVKGTEFGPIYALSYDYWVEQRRRLVDSLSDGRLAYIHIRRMYPDALEKFKLEIVNETQDKDGVVLDVRYNGGGNIAVHLLGILIKEPYIYRNFAGYPVISENKMRSKALEKPSILLINNGSGSNSEIFAEGYRKLGLGTIVGERTAGGVIGTASYYLIDGTRIRRPSWGCYTTDMENLELVPRYPDITVEKLLTDVVKGRDPQLERAVKELLEQIGSETD
jgi:Tol biopolymer transport system component/C-terminal processing protease CtpA/Prc